MFTRGEYIIDNDYFGVIMKHTKLEMEIILVKSGEVASAYKKDSEGEYGFLTSKAKDMSKVIYTGIKGCKAKNATSLPFVLGSSMMYEFTKAKVEYTIETFNNEVVAANIMWGDNNRISLEYTDNENLIPSNIPYIKLTTTRQKDIAEDSSDDVEVVVRSVQEIALEKEDISWLQTKKYYIVNDDAEAEKIFAALDNWNGPVSYDTETTGLKINCFGKIGSKYKKQLEEYNASHPDSQLRADRLVGIIFCVEENISYYFPCFNRLFKNLYDSDTPERKAIIELIKKRYETMPLNPMQWDMYNYFHNTPESEWTSDVILMERVRWILETRHIVAHNGSFEYKVGCQYGIDTNLKDDTMIMHQIMYKFRTTTSNRGEPSNLKYLAKVELGIDQWELSDFFPDFKEDNSGLVRGTGKSRGKKSGSKIDFSYMTYEGARVYAPTDGDVTFLLFKKYKADMIKNHKEQEYIYGVEVIVSCAIGYMEFWGHRLDEKKIYGVRDQTKAEIACIESEIRQKVNYAEEKEIEAYNELKEALAQFESLNDASDDEREAANNDMLEKVDNLYKVIAENHDHELNLGSPSQVAELFYDVLGYPMQGDKKSVASKQIKPLLKAKNEDGTPTYPVVVMYSDYKKKDTLMTKFYDNLPYFMYPGGLIFSSFGQISTATGRMSCSHPNAQQYPKAITGIVIPRDGFVMMDADYSQIEYRVLTALAGNEWLAKLFEDPDSDYHTLMASMMYGVDYASVTPRMRSDAKSFNFGIPYGMGFSSLAILLTGNSKPSSVEEAKEKYELYFKNQPNTRKFFNQVKEMAQVNKFTRTHWGRYRYYSFTDANGNENNAKKAAALRQAGNAIIQGCLDGDTRIQTKEYGIVKIKDVVDQHLMVWDGDKWSNGDILYSGKKQKCVITFSNGQKFICSPIHKFLVRSAKGNERFIECKDLATKQNSKNPHRIVVNPEYCKSDSNYSSNWAAKFNTNANNSHNAHIDDIYESFDMGVLLGRIASDGTIGIRDKGASYILNYVAEHEENILPEMQRITGFLGDTKEHKVNRINRNESMYRLYNYSESLAQEVRALDIKHTISDRIFADTEMLRGFLRGMFDGDGGISGRTITLTFGTQADFEPLCRDIQKALLFFGIRSRYYKYNYRSKITIKTNDNERFMSLIGFMNSDKNDAGNSLEGVRDEHIFGRILIPESVEITDEYIDMYDVCNTDGGYYVADGIVTHNTAADVFKISVARNFMYMREQHILGQLLIVNMIHDEQLFEVDVQHLNMRRVIADVGCNMQFKVEGFPPLYIGAGIGPAWGKAKGKMAEIHPKLLDAFIEEASTIPLKHTEGDYVDPKEVLKYFADRVLEFRRQKVRDYLLDPENYGKDLHPAIGNLINLQFTYGHDKEKEGLKDDEFTQLCVKEFIEHEGLEGVKPEFFIAKTESMEDTEDEDEEYTDGEEDDEDELDINDSVFTVIDESDVVYGTSVQDLIANFGFFVSRAHRICGINSINLHYTKKDQLVDFLYAHLCDEDDPDAMEIVFLQEGNILNRTGVYVKNIGYHDLESRIAEIPTTA